MKYFSNKEIARMLMEIAAAYQAKGENRFKVVAYENAADSIEHATVELKDLWEDGQLGSLQGLGPSIQKHIEELFQKGKVSHFETVKKDLPPGMFTLLGIPGLGPKNAFKLAQQLKVKSPQELQAAAKAGKVRNLAGFGEKSEKEILTSLEDTKEKNTRYKLTEAFPVAQRLIKYLLQSKYCQRVDTMGSLRRMVSTVGDIDISVSSKNPKEVIDHFLKFREIKRVLDAGPRKSSVLLQNDMQIDLIVQPQDAYGALLQHFTGSKAHNIHLREYALKKGYSVSDYGIKVNGKIKKFKSEEEFYKFLGMSYIPPELREDSGEIEAALKNNLPQIIDLKDIKGDLHLHSSYNIEPSHDLGENTFKEIIQKARTLNYEYIGLSDHSPSYSKHTKAQIVDLVKKRSENIEQLKPSEKGIRILNLLEIDILVNGELSIPDDALKLLDGAIAGIHSGHNQDKKSITKRLLTAINSPYVHIISHPTGRLLMQRDAYEVNWKAIFEACYKTHTMLEINSWPSRLDLPDILVREAIKNGVKMVIDTDAHEISQMDNMNYGVSVARRGWATRKDILNTAPWLEFKKHFGVS